MTSGLGFGLDEFRIRGFGLGLELGGRGLGFATMGLDYISASDTVGDSSSSLVSP